MRRFKKRVQRGRVAQTQERSDRMAAAERYVFRVLEREWRDRLGGRPIPRAQRQIMRRDPAFRALVAKRLMGEPLVFEDRTFVPDHETAPDGTERDRFLEAMAGDPRAFYCVSCGEEEVGRVGERCDECQEALR